MRFIRDIYREGTAARQPVVSVEFFPTKTEEGERTLLEKTIPELMRLKPDFCSVTYGAGGSTRDKTLYMVERIQREHRLPAMAHLTCVNSTQQHIAQILREAQAKGIRNILALRGDPPGGGEFHKVDGGFEYSYELVKFIRTQGDYSIGVAGFPEGHVACKEGREVDWQRLRHKIACGADFVITQLFFDNRDYFAMREFLTRQGVTVPLVPGIIPILSAAQIKKFTALCGAALPEALLKDLDRFANDDEGATQFGIEYATRQCAELMREGAPGLHFYTLNKVRSTAAIVRNLGLAPAN
jgi:methylenetetrahydrofolate reductase (NADPH)